MTSTIKNEKMKEAGEKIQSLRRGSLKTVFYIVVLTVSLSVTNFIFGWATVKEIPPVLQPFSSIILLINPYLTYIQAVLIFGLGYLVVNAVSGITYTYMRRISDHPTATTIRTITRICGLAVLLSMLASVFNVNPAAALTVGSFGGLVMGFATQTILTHVVAGVFLLVSRPYTFGDTITVAGQTGVVKEIKLMHLVLESTDGTREILIPSGTVVTQIIQKMKPIIQPKPIETSLILEAPPRSVPAGSPIIFTGKLVEVETGNPIKGATIKIFDRDIDRDDLLASGITESDGRFNIKWAVSKTDRLDNNAEIYAKFEGNDDYQPSKSKQFIVEIK